MFREQPMKPQFNDEGSVPVVIPRVLVLLPLSVLLLELLLYTVHVPLQNEDTFEQLHPFIRNVLTT